jgi:hypothetical protein
VLKIDPADLADLGRMLTFLQALPPVDLPTVSDLAIVDDGSAIMGEVMNLLARRNLLFEVVQAPSPRFPLTIRIGTPEYPREEATDPSAYGDGEAHVAGAGRLVLEDRVISGGATEFTIPRIATYAVIDLRAAR